MNEQFPTANWEGRGGGGNHNMRYRAKSLPVYPTKINKQTNKQTKQTLKNIDNKYSQAVRWHITLPQSPIIHVGHGLMLQGSLNVGLFSSLHPGLNWPLASLQLTFRCLIPSPQETEHWNMTKKSPLEFRLKKQETEPWCGKGRHDDTIRGVRLSWVNIT